MLYRLFVATRLATMATLSAAQNELAREPRGSTAFDDLAHRRRAFAEETAAAVTAVAAIGEFDYHLRHSSRDLH
jgi:hypothetical protein